MWTVTSNGGNSSLIPFIPIESETARYSLPAWIFKARSSVYQLHAIHPVPQQPASEVCSPHLTQFFGLGHVQVCWMDFINPNVFSNNGN